MCLKCNQKLNKFIVNVKWLWKAKISFYFALSALLTNHKNFIVLIKRRLFDVRMKWCRCIICLHHCISSRYNASMRMSAPRYCWYTSVYPLCRHLCFPVIWTIIFITTFLSSAFCALLFNNLNFMLAAINILYTLSENFFK